MEPTLYPDLDPQEVRLTCLAHPTASIQELAMEPIPCAEMDQAAIDAILRLGLWVGLRGGHLAPHILEGLHTLLGQVRRVGARRYGR